MKPDPNNVFMTMTRNDLGKQAIVLLEKMLTPNKPPREEEFLLKQCDRLLEAFKFKVNHTTDAH